MVFLRYGLVAGIAYGIDFGGYIFLLGMGNTPIVANALIKVIAAIFGFFAHRYFTYSITERNDLGKHAARYFGLALFYTPTSSAALYGIIFLLPDPIYAKAATDVSLFLLMFWVTSKFSFKKTVRSDEKYLR
jgi:putative flippase GtrA